VGRFENHIHLDLIEIAPQYQRQDLGTKQIGQLVVESDRRGVPIRLRVLTTNPAKGLYERLGFRVIRETAERYWMERPLTLDEDGWTDTGHGQDD
jgi:ribosomal protein S18 acetylase RimI-like enzyme